MHRLIIGTSNLEGFKQEAMLTDEIKARRLGRITSSIAGACLGVDPHKSPADALDEILGRAPEFAGNKATERGNLTERAIVEYGLAPARSFAPGIASLYAPAPHVTHPEGWSADSSDALCVDASGGVLAVMEGKSVGLGARNQWGEPNTDEVPAKVFVQACWHLIHWPTARFCLVPVLFGGYDFEFQHYVVERDATLLERITGKLRDWHARHVVGGEPVPLGPADTERLLERWPAPVEEEAPLTPELVGWVERLLEADRIASAANKDREAARFQIRQIMQDKAQCRADAWAVTYRKPKASASVNWRAIAEVLGATPELIAAHTTQTENTRRLCVTPLRKLKA